VSPPRWSSALLRRLAPSDEVEDVLGDLEETHRARVERRGSLIANLLTGLESLDMAFALVRGHLRGGAGRGERPGVAFSWLDFKLGFRMLTSYPLLTVVGGLAMALAIAVSALVFELGNQLIHAKLSLEDGDRIVALRLWHTATRSVEEQAVPDFVAWRGQLKSIEDLGAFRGVYRNLITSRGQAGSVGVAEMTVSGFRLTRVRPLLGRLLVDTDEQPGAAPVVVIGERIWRMRFASDPNVLGSTVRLGATPSTVVGVMPEGFGFPAGYGVWAPLNIDSLRHARREGPAIRMFGRLARGVSLEAAQAELTGLGERASAAFPDTHEHLRPQVMPYARSFVHGSWRMVVGLTYSGYLFALMFLILVCANVATLVFARTATRESEIAVRTALGASRMRVVSQLHAESLVLGVFAALLGLAAADFGMRLIVENLVSDLFWLKDRLSAATVLYAVMLTILGAFIAGALPALKVTSGLAERLRQGAVGGTHLRFGRVWTSLIVTQVALTVVFMTLTLDVAMDGARARNLVMGFPAEQFLAVNLEMVWQGSSRGEDTPPTSAELEQFETTYRELERRLRAEPAVSQVTLASTLPGLYHPFADVQADGKAPPPKSGAGHSVLIAAVDPSYFDVFGARILAGRGFQPADLGSEQVVIVNESFVRQVLGGGNAIGRRVRHVENSRRSNEPPQEKWYEIVGVVNDMAMTGDPDLLGKGMGGFYHPLPRGLHHVRMAVHVKGDAAAFAPRVRNLVTEVDPRVRVTDLRSLNDIKLSAAHTYAFFLRIALAASAIVLLLSISGVYSTLSFTVARRTREVGIRTALGATRHRIVLAIFSRALMQVGIGIAAGAGIMLVTIGGIASARGAVLAILPAAFMVLLCMLACVVPTWRALSIQPTVALKTD
jgi:putative ABC transport system permease protein